MGQCGLCAKTKETQIVKNVKDCDNYIACDDDTLSEIVVPCFDANGNFKTMLDLDSPNEAEFDQVDDEWLRKILKLYYK